MQELFNINLPLFLGHLRQAVLVLAPDGSVLYRNPIFSSLFSRELSINKTEIKKILKHNPTIFEAFEKVLDQGNSYYLRDVDVNLIGKPAQPMDVEILSIASEENQLLNVVLLFRDRKAHIRQEEHQMRADRIASFKTMASGLAHEIRNPLSGILGAAQLLSKELKNQPDWKELSQIIVQETQRVDKLVAQLMNLSRPRAMQKEAVNINGLLHDLVILQKSALSNNIIITENYDPSLPPILIDRELIKQVFVNLIKNAVEVLPNGGLIQIRSRVNNDFGLKTPVRKTQFLAVDIEDSGEGISEEQMTKIFVPFFTTKATGTGLGLPLCYQIVEEHQGDFRIESKPGKTVFSVYLPLG